jgi:hypothetical protein
MAKLTKAQRRTIERALESIVTAKERFMDPRGAWCSRDSMATTTLHYVRPSDGACLYELARGDGSGAPDAYMSNAARDLRNLLDS